MDINDIINKFSDENDKMLIKNAYDFAKYRLDGKYHFSGIPLLDYWLEVVNVLFRFNVDYLTVMSSILYETINYGTDLREIEFIFGSEVRDIIYKLKCINDSEFIGNIEQLNSYYDTMNKEYSCDFKTLFIKLGERFRHLELIKDCSDDYKKVVADDTLTVLSPVAHKVGLTYLKSQLDDVCLEYLEPEKYHYILGKLGKHPNELREDVICMKNSISTLLRENKIDADYKWRTKNIMGIYKKLLKGKEWEDIYDIMGITVIAADIYDCYRIFDIISSSYRVISSEFKDYISFPKDNGYRALHICICAYDGRMYEIQIKTSSMYIDALSNHYIYKLKKYQ